MLVPEARTWGPRHLPVPYAAYWSGEGSYGRRVMMRPDGAGIWYPDETRADRDAFGVLWARVTDEPGQGRPEFSALHPARQRRAQAERLCQVCGKVASHTRDGWLFLMTGDDEDDADAWEGSLSTKPPICLPCAALATRFCPHLAHPLGVRARRPKIWGAFGTLFIPTPDARIRAHPDDQYLPYGHRASRWFLASQLVVELKRCTVVDLETEFAALA